MAKETRLGVYPSTHNTEAWELWVQIMQRGFPQNLHVGWKLELTTWDPSPPSSFWRIGHWIHSLFNARTQCQNIGLLYKKLEGQSHFCLVCLPWKIQPLSTELLILAMQSLNNCGKWPSLFRRPTDLYHTWGAHWVAKVASAGRGRVASLNCTNCKCCHVKLYFQRFTFILTFAGVLPEWMHVHHELSVHGGVQEGVSDILELELQATASCHVGAGDQTPVLQKSSQCSTSEPSLQPLI